MSVLLPLPEGVVHPGDDVGRQLQFTAERFEGYLFVRGEAVYISFILSRQRGAGHLRALFEAIWQRGYTVKVPTALPRMQAILAHWDFTQVQESDAEFGVDGIDVWVRRDIPPNFYRARENDHGTSGRGEGVSS